MKTSLVILALISMLPALAAAGNISPSDKYAWSEAAGWSNFTPSNGGVSVYDNHLEGFAWAENAGWIKLGSHSSGGYFTYANSNAGDWGVNLDGWAWSENLGWIRFKSGSPVYNILFSPSPQVTSVLFDAADVRKVHATVAGSGVHLSSDGGASCTAAASRPGDRRLRASVASPLAPAILYTPSHGSGVFKSVDSGSTGRPAPTPVSIPRSTRSPSTAPPGSMRPPRAASFPAPTARPGAPETPPFRITPDATARPC